MPLCRAALAALLLLAVAARPAPAQEPAPEPAPGAVPSRPAAQRLDSGLPRRCGVCHLDRAPAAAPGLLVFAPPERAAAAGDAGMCYSCHNGIVVDSRRSTWTGRHHPASGKVTCGTCHTPHARTADVGTFMRYPRGSFAYCGTCHPGRRSGDLGEHPSVAQEKGKAQDCGSCHAVHGATGEGLLRLASAESLCTSCHGENPSKAGRGPGTTTHVVGKSGPPCLGCHGVHRTVGGKALLDRAAHEGRLCRQCHEKQFSAAKAEANHPVAAGGATCLGCHRMHNAEKPAAGRRGLLKTAWAAAGTLCDACHEAQRQDAGGLWNHPVGGALGADERNQGARLARSGAFFAPGGKLTCLSCHRSHGGRPKTPQLVAPREALCLYCHPDQNSLDAERAALGAHPVLVRPQRARVDAAFLNAGGVTGPGGELTCTTCHRAHRGRPGTPGMVLPRDAYSCLLCHSRETSIAATAHSGARVPGSTQGPGAAGLCGGCHGEHGWRVPLGEAAGGGTAIERICAACHGAPEGAPAVAATNHPLGAALGPGRGPAGLPLFWSDGRRYRQGVITCATCHDVHRRGPLGRFLREGLVLGSGETCVGCHGDQQVVVKTKHDLSGPRGATCGPCHPVHDPLGVAAWPAARGGGDRAGYDLAGFCTGCHNATGTAAAAVVAERTHPATAGAGRKTVGCGACHDPHRWNPADRKDRGGREQGDGRTSFLVRPSAGPSDLCAGCHADQAAVVSSPHDLTKLAAAGRAPGVDDPARHGICAACHRVHGPQPLALPAAVPPAKPAKPGEKTAVGPDPCELCHAAGRLAAASITGEHGHPVGVSTGQDFGPDLPLYGPDGRRRAGGRIACATCHDPHRWEPPGGAGAKTKAATSFLRLGADGYAPLCFPCHADKSMVVGTDHDLRVTAPRAVNLAGQAAETSGVCGACHAVHRGPEAFSLWNRGFGEGRDVRSRACAGCHRPGNDQGARVPPRTEAHLVNYPGRGLVSRMFTASRGAGAITLFGEDGHPGEQGYLSCASCHDVHRWESTVSNSGSGVAVEGDASNSFLRVGLKDLERTICAECHGADLQQYFRTYHFPEGK